LHIKGFYIKENKKETNSLCFNSLLPFFYGNRRQIILHYWAFFPSLGITLVVLVGNQCGLQAHCCSYLSRSGC